MRYYRCKCGETEIWSTFGPARCRSCEFCKSGLALAPCLLGPPEPHDLSITMLVTTDEGPKPLTRCRACGKTKSEIRSET